MKATLSNNKKVSVRWQYDNCISQVRKGSANQEVQQDCTSCIISDENREEIVRITVKRYFKDPVNKVLARRHTFQLAVKSFSKEDRALLWDEFRKNVRTK